MAEPLRDTSDVGAVEGAPDLLARSLAIELRHLRYFLAVSEELHFGRAAARLHIAQPPLSQAIRKLERELGVELLHRTSRVVALTEAGSVLVREARGVLTSFAGALVETRRAGGATVTLRIGSVPYLPMDRLLAFLSALNDLQPRMPREVTHLPQPEQVRRLHSRQLDVGIYPDFERRKGIHTAPLFPGEPMIVWIAADHRLVSRDVVRLKDLQDETLVTFPRASHPALHAWVLSRLEALNCRVREVREPSGPDERDVLVAVACGVGVAVVPSSIERLSAAETMVARRPLDPLLSLPPTVVAWAAHSSQHLEHALAAIREVSIHLSAEAATSDGSTD
jgi:DNA-binding transcriptional LysR family regulator